MEENSQLEFLASLFDRIGWRTYFETAVEQLDRRQAALCALVDDALSPWADAQTHIDYVRDFDSSLRGELTNEILGDHFPYVIFRPHPEFRFSWQYARGAVLFEEEAAAARRAIAGLTPDDKYLDAQFGCLYAVDQSDPSDLFEYPEHPGF